MILRADWVIPVSSSRIANGFVEIEGGRIANVGSAADLSDHVPVVDLGRAVLTPGLVNAHTHLELTSYAGQLAPAPFWDWVRNLLALRRQPDQVEREKQGVAEGAWQSLRAGVTCVGDISRQNTAWHVLKSIPIRKVCFAELLSRADQSPRDPAELRAAVEAIEEDELLTAGVTPHAPYTVPADEVRAAVALATELDRPWCTHWAETREELAFLAGGLAPLPPFMQAVITQCGVASPQMAPGAYLRRCVAGLKPGLVAHGNYFSQSDVELVAADGHTLAYCPRAHRFYGHDRHPLLEARAAGLRVVLATDSAAGTDNLALLEDARFTAAEVPHPPPAETLLRMITLDAAGALSLAHEIGSLERGKAADVVVWPAPPDGQRNGEADPVAALVAAAPQPRAVYVAGRRVV